MILLTTMYFAQYNQEALIEMSLATRKDEPSTGGGDGLPNVPAPTPVVGSSGTKPDTKNDA